MAVDPDSGAASVEPLHEVERECRPLVRWAVLLAGLILPQVVLIGPALIGRTYLLPLDRLGGSGMYLPAGFPGAAQPAKDGTRADLIVQAEVQRRYVVDEVRSGRLPLWNPYNYCGHPLLASNQAQVFSPFMLLSYAWPSPVVLGWVTLAESLVAGVGTFLLLRRAVDVHWLAAAVAAWAYPLSGTMILSNGFAGSAVLSFLPWVLLGVECNVSRPNRRGVALLSVAVALALLSGHAAFAGQVLLAAVAYFVFRMASVYGRSMLRQNAVRATVFVATGVGCGVLLSGVQTLPTLDYLKSSHRIAERDAGAVETSPGGPMAMVQVLLPYVRGSNQRGSIYTGPEQFRIESAAGGYVSVFATLLLMPLGWADPKRRRWMIGWTIIALLAMVPAVDVPGLSRLFRLPPLSLFRNHRLVFVWPFAILAMSAAGLDALLRPPAVFPRKRFMPPLLFGMVVAVSLSVWCLERGTETPSTDDLPRGSPVALFWPDSWASVGHADLLNWFALMYNHYGLLCGAVFAVGGLLAVTLWRLPAAYARPTRPLVPPSSNRETLRRLGPAPFQERSRVLRVAGLAIAALAISEMTAEQFGVAVQGSPSLYYPRLAWMDIVQQGGGRLCGFECLPANLNLAWRLPDIRGYDAVDPLPTVELVKLCQDPRTVDSSPPHAVVGETSVSPNDPGPVANLLAVRYIVGRGQPPTGMKTVYADADYWLVENRGALPRVTVPSNSVVLPDPSARLQELAKPSHHPADTTVLENADSSAADGQGTATIAAERPGLVEIHANLSQAGRVRLADSYDPGWVATVNGQTAVVQRVDHALMAVTAPTGASTILFRYQPASFNHGLTLTGAGFVFLAAALARPKSKIRFRPDA